MGTCITSRASRILSHPLKRGDGEPFWCQFFSWHGRSPLCTMPGRHFWRAVFSGTIRTDEALVCRGPLACERSCNAFLLVDSDESSVHIRLAGGRAPVVVSFWAALFFRLRSTPITVPSAEGLLACTFGKTTCRVELRSEGGEP